MGIGRECTVWIYCSLTSVSIISSVCLSLRRSSVCGTKTINVHRVGLARKWSDAFLYEG